LRLVLISSSRAETDLKDVDGTAFLDTLAPINAILKVREDLANDAVGRACSEFYPWQKNGCIKHAGQDGKLQFVEIQDQTYGLPLGWKISQTSFAVIAWMLGSEESCRHSDKTSPVQSNDDPHAQLTATISDRNSCVSRLLLDLVRKSTPP